MKHLLILALLMALAGCGANAVPSPASSPAQPATAPGAMPGLATALATAATAPAPLSGATLALTAAPTAVAPAVTAETVVSSLLAAERAGGLDQLLRLYDEHASHILLDATAGNRSAGFTSYHNSPAELRTYWAALLQDHLSVDVVDVRVSTGVPPVFSAGLGGKAEQVTVRSRQALDSRRQAGVQFAQVLDNYLIVSGRIVSQATPVARDIPIGSAALATADSLAGIYAATRNLQPPFVAFGDGFLVFAEQGHFYLMGADNGILDGGPYRTSGAVLRLTSNDPDCHKAGRSPDFTYQWSLAGSLLTLNSLLDQCGSGHAQLFSGGPWLKQW